MACIFTIMLTIPVQVNKSYQACAGYCYEEESIYTEGNGGNDGTDRKVNFSIEERIQMDFAEYGTDAIEWITSVSFCESTHNPLAFNRSSGSMGLFQFMRGTFDRYSQKDVWTVEGQFDAMKNMLEIYGFEVLRDSHHWLASRHCWE